MVESDLRTGNNRNPIEFVTGLTGGVFIGFAAGAAVYGVIAAAPALAAGVDQKAVMFLGETGFTTKVVPEIIKASAGVIAAAETVFSINDAYTCGSGYNPLLDVVFDDNVEAYETIEFCVDMLALGYVQAAETYGKTPSDQGVYIENENNLHDYDDGQLDDMHTQGKGGNNEKTIQSNNVKKTGASRAAQYSSSWQSGSVKDSISKFAPDATPVYTDKGKIIYRNESTGIEIVYDRNGNYYRIIDTNLSGKRTALDINGNKVPNNVLTEKGTQRGITQSEYNAITHFNNTDLDFDK